MTGDNKKGHSHRARSARLADALRRNLRRRKLQARGRAAPQPAKEKTGPDNLKR